MSYTESLSSGPPSPAKKRVVGIQLESMFPYPELDSDCVNNDDGDASKPSSMLRHCELIAAIDSVVWGTPALATERALLETKVTPATQELLRTYHPSLAACKDVWLIQEENGNWMWGISSELNGPRPVGTHAGGLEIHLVAHGLGTKTTTFFPKFQWDPIRYPINPKKFLSRHQLRRLRDMFPTAVGVRVLISGFIVVLFTSIKAIEKSWYEDGFASEFGNLRLRYDVFEVTPSHRGLHRGAAIAPSPESLETHASLGLKLRFPEGQEVITVPTHAFVALRSTQGPSSRYIAHIFGRLVQKLARYRPIGRGVPLPAIGSPRRRSEINSPIGKQVFLNGDSQQIGTISHTYDRISDKPLQFPAGFQHDLSLASADSHFVKLPDLQAPAGMPHVVGWGGYQDFLNGGAVFVTAFNVPTGNLIVRSGTGISEQSQFAISEGSQYLWDRAVTSHNVSLLWRTTNDCDSLKGLSGSAVCLGKITDKTCLAVCFQNFESPVCSSELLKDDHRPLPPEDHRLSLKGGFLLPPEVRKAEIACLPADSPCEHGTYPRNSIHTEELWGSSHSTN
ncbi:hypothetical protein POX_h09421 [Penicillium oxalicum]|uniref:hypothetical protein n=1 Tax=Penicillium oxalicum TaxID=69781 RepID=UPI0020B7506D|nr:hypothetical protein POX_h09421 [Penicillium oxalicum]KAI2785663.1 hypothetical protein POX_h09421 [Penicillium oxalicum]